MDNIIYHHIHINHTIPYAKTFHTSLNIIIASALKTGTTFTAILRVEKFVWHQHFGDPQLLCLFSSAWMFVSFETFYWVHSNYILQMNDPRTVSKLLNFGVQLKAAKCGCWRRWWQWLFLFSYGAGCHRGTKLYFSWSIDFLLKYLNRVTPLD